MSRFSPRLTSSTKWTDIPEDFLAKVLTVFNNQFKEETKDGEFIAAGRIYPNEIVLRVGYLEEGRLKQINFEASMDLKKVATSVLEERETEAFADREAETAKTTIDRLYVCIDALGSLFEEYFQTNDETQMDVPLYWKIHEFEGDEVYLQHSTANTRLEDEADRILGLLGDDLVIEENASEDALAVAEIDSELAQDVSAAIRSGRYRPNIPDMEEPN